MLSKELSNKILSIGGEYNPPKGGVAQVMYTYSKEVYPIFHCVTNSGNGGFVRKLWIFVQGIVKSFFSLLFNRNIKIVHIHTASYNSFKRSSYFVLLAKCFKKKVVLHIHGGAFKEYYKTNPKWIKNTLQKVDKVVALTESWKSFFQDEVCLSNVVVINNIVPSPQIKAIEKDGKFHLLFLGAINEQKGIFDLVEVINQHKNEWRGKLILHIGGNQDVERLQNYISNNILFDLIKYEGWVSGEKKIELLNICDVFILPSYIEGLPISILEALSYGKPVITTPVGGIPEVVNDQNGFLFTPGDLKALAKIIGSLLDNSMLVQEMSINAKVSVDKNFSYNITEALDSLYRDLLSM